MTSFLLLRHAETDYSLPAKWHTPGWGADLAPLTPAGERHVEAHIESIKEWNPEIVICSPTTRTLHTALILRSQLTVPFRVEFDLHEWVPHRGFDWRTHAEVMALQADLNKHNGEWPPGEERNWEPLSSVCKRALAVFRRYLDFERVLVVCHGILIRSVTEVKDLKFVGSVPFELKREDY